MQPLISDSELWLTLYVSSKDAVPELYGLMVTYVDDILHLALLRVMHAAHGAVAHMWPRSALELASKLGGIRYLGMELEEGDGMFTLGQRGCVDNLAKSYGLAAETVAGLPCPKDWLFDEEGAADQENFSEDELRRGQKIVGDMNFMSSVVGERPCHTIRIGMKVLAYLHGSASLKLTMNGASE